MIAPLRKRHRLMVFILAPFTLIVFSLAVISRNQVPSDNQLIGVDKKALDIELVSALTIQGDEKAHFSANLHKGPLGRFIEISPLSISEFPDVLVYQTAGELMDATLLGSFKGVQEFYPVSDEPIIILYSLAHQRELIRISLEKSS